MIEWFAFLQFLKVVEPAIIKKRWRAMGSGKTTICNVYSVFVLLILFVPFLVKIIDLPQVGI